MEIFKGDIKDAEAEVIVNAANRIGFMGGWIGRLIKTKGVAESIHYHTKGRVEWDARKYAWTHHLKRGDVYKTKAYQLKASFVYHAITMTFPGTYSTVEIVELCIINIIKKIETEGVKSIAIPMLGTGVGGVSFEKVANLYIKYFKEKNDVKIIVVDPSGKFESYLK